ncbi:MAG: hypothetical protein NTV86_03195, partial [Planctomycetota bacterium]|nr:hypothetical protein [Planctomycetota bacterium]
AFFQSYESFNAYSFIQGNNRVGAAGAQALVAEWIAKGGSAALGAVEEPKAGTTAEEDQVVRMMLDGYTWAEAAWSATWQLSYVNTVVGDPLMQWSDSPPVEFIPEPASLALLVAGVPLLPRRRNAER